MLRKLRTISVKLPEEVVVLLDMLVRNGEFHSRSEIIRKALIAFLKNLIKNSNPKCTEQKIQEAIKALEAMIY